MAKAWACLEEEYPKNKNPLFYFILTMGVIGVAYGVGTVLSLVTQKNTPICISIQTSLF